MPTVAEIIHQRHDEIMELWLDETRKIASAKGLAHAALQNVMPRYLTALGEQLGHEEADAARDAQRRSQLQSHLSTRIRQGYQFAELLHELVALGRSIARMWTTLPPNEWPTTAQIEALDAAIQAAIAEATDTFQRHMVEDEQLEKRYLRQLQTIANVTLQDGALRDRLREMLEVMMEAMGAQSAAALVYSVPEHEIVLCASAGVGSPEAYATSFEPEVQLADDEQVFDAKAAVREVPPALASTGIRALLAVRLPATREALANLYIGMTEPHAFTDREICRSESLGERFALHLQNSRLFAELRDKVDALAVECSLRERFVAILAHDLRGPLASARIAAEMLRTRPPEHPTLITRIESNLDRVDRMIRDLLDANRIRAGEPLPLRLEETDLVTLASHVIEEARALYGDRFVLRSDGPVRGIWSADELHRTLWNLVTNAVKYGAKRPITITVARTPETARITVHNEGLPIPASDLPYIFDAYTRTLAARRGSATGWGLGLTLVRGSVEAHGGHVAVTSEPAAGTTFTIDLPLDARPFQTHGVPPPTVH